MSRTFHEIFLLGRILQGNVFSCKILARCLAEKCIILQDLERKSCKILARNAFFFNQGSIGLIQYDPSRMDIKFCDKFYVMRLYVVCSDEVCYMTAILLRPHIPHSCAAEYSYAECEAFDAIYIL